MAVSPKRNINREIFEITLKKLSENEAWSESIIVDLIAAAADKQKFQKVITKLSAFSEDDRPKKKITAKSTIGRALQYIGYKVDDFFSITGDSSLMLQVEKFKIEARLANPNYRGLVRFGDLLFFAVISGSKLVTDFIVRVARIKHAIFDSFSKKVLRTEAPQEQEWVPPLENRYEGVSPQSQNILDRNDPFSPNFKLFTLVSSGVVASEEIANDKFDTLFAEADLHARDLLNNSILLFGIANANVNTTIHYLNYIKKKFPIESITEVNHGAIGGLTPLHLAIYKGFDYQDGQKGEMSKMIEALVYSGGININAQDKYGNTPLHIALMRRDYKCAFRLLNEGANADIRNKEDLTPGDMFSMDDNKVREICHNACSVFTMEPRAQFAQSSPKEIKKEAEIQYFSLNQSNFDDPAHRYKMITFILNGSKKFVMEIQELKSSNSLTKDSLRTALCKHFWNLKIDPDRVRHSESMWAEPLQNAATDDKFIKLMIAFLQNLLTQNFFDSHHVQHYRYPHFWDSLKNSLQQDKPKMRLS